MHGWPERCNISGFEGGEGEPRTKACSSTENGVWPQPTGSRKTGTWIPHPQGTEFCQQIKCTGKRFSLEPPYRNSGANTLFQPKTHVVFLTYSNKKQHRIKPLHCHIQGGMENETKKSQFERAVEKQISLPLHFCSRSLRSSQDITASSVLTS